MNAGIRVIATIKAESRFGPKGMEIWRHMGVRRGRTPAWFRRIVDRDYCGTFNAPWFDHHGVDGESLVVEPYDLYDESLRDLVAFADKHSLKIHISAISSHYPTRTVSASLIPRENG